MRTAARPGQQRPGFPGAGFSQTAWPWTRPIYEEAAGLRTGVKACRSSDGHGSLTGPSATSGDRKRPASALGFPGSCRSNCCEGPMGRGGPCGRGRAGRSPTSSHPGFGVPDAQAGVGVTADGRRGPGA